MPDAPVPTAPVPTASDSAASLQIARGAGGDAFLAEFNRLSAAGAVVGREDHALAETLLRHRAGLDTAEGPRDPRTPAQKIYDEANGIQATDPGEYFVHLPHEMRGLDSEAMGAVNSDARSLASSLGLGINEGNNFIASVLDTGMKLERMSADERGETVERWRSQVKEVLGDRFQHALNLVDKFVAAKAGDNRLIHRLAERNVTANPQIFVRLYHLALLHDARPGS